MNTICECVSSVTIEERIQTLERVVNALTKSISMGADHSIDIDNLNMDGLPINSILTTDMDDRIIFILEDRYSTERNAYFDSLSDVAIYISHGSEVDPHDLFKLDDVPLKDYFSNNFFK